MANVNSKKVLDWVKQEQGKHFCKCGCGEKLNILGYHYFKGIVEYKKGHSKKKPTILWVKLHQGKFFCKCGCGQGLLIKRRHKFLGIPEYIQGHHPNPKRSEPKNTQDNFWEKVDKSKGGCWLWQGCTNGIGYGAFSYKGKVRLAHRLSYFFLHGCWPNGSLCHNCPGGDNSLCVNPDHLFIGTQADNMWDAAVKLRMIRKFQPEKILEVVKLVGKGLNRKEAAALVGMSHAMATKIMDGSVWSHLTGIPRKVKKPKKVR